jgi:broad specificity phosphatase PhoE
LRAAGLVPPALISGGLKRTRRTAAIIAERLGLPQPKADSRLDEIDYGSWEGLPNAEVDARGGAEAQIAWNERDSWPAGAGWLPDEAGLKARLASFVADWTASPDPAMVVTSSGILRFLARLLLPEAAWDRPSFKMRTGRVGIIEDRRLVRWDAGPGEIGGG